MRRPRLRKVLFSLSCIFFLHQLVSIMPGINMFHTDFGGLNNLSISNMNVQGAQGVAKIEWGLWQACYFPANDNIITTRMICTQTHFLGNPYTLTITGTENGKQTRATVQEKWLRFLSIQFPSPFYNILLLLLLYRLLKRVDDDIASTVTVMTAGALATVTLYEGLIRRLRFIMGFTSIVWVMALIIVLADYIVLRSIESELRPLIAGPGVTSVSTTRSEGFIVSMTGSLGIFVISFYAFCAAVVEIDKVQENFQASGAQALFNFQIGGGYLATLATPPGNQGGVAPQHGCSNCLLESWKGFLKRFRGCTLW